MNDASTQRSDDQAEADREFHEATAHLYDDVILEVFGAYYDLAIRPALDALARRAPGRDAVDIGCGTGLLTVELAERGFDVRGIDHSPAMLSRAEQRVEAAGYSHRVEFVTGDIRDLPWDDDSFDLLTCQGVLHHLDDLDATVRECARVLRPGGCFFIAEPCLGSTLLLRAWDRIRTRIAPAPPTPSPGAGVPHHEEGPVDPVALQRVLSRHGLAGHAGYWTHFEGAHRLPRPVERALIRWGSRPWRRRSGNLVYLTGALATNAMRSRKSGAHIASATPVSSAPPTRAPASGRE